jgi:hypothetical protein
MEKLAARAALVPAPGVSEGIATSVSRSEIEEVLATESEPIQLVLDVKRFSDGQSSESHTVAVSWERSDLERVLEEATSDQIVLTFDGEALRQAVEADVEAHGLRELALTLAVAATAATGAGQATAAVDSGARAGIGTAVTQTAGPDDRDVSLASPMTPASQLGVDDRAVPRATPTPAPQLGVDDRAVPRATPTPAPGVAPDDRAVPRAATPIDTPALAPDDRAVPRTTPIEAPGLSPDDRAVPRAGAPIDMPAAGTASDPGTAWAPSPAETIVLAGGIALAIAGAFFLVGDRRVRPRPI